MFANYVKPAGAAALVLNTLILTQMASACSTFMVNSWYSDSPGGPNVVSGRTMDFDSLDLNGTLNIVPKGSVLYQNLYDEDFNGTGQVADTAAYFTTKHGYVAAVSNLWQPKYAEQMPAELTTPIAKAKSLLSGVADGLNDAGLSCAILYDKSLIYNVFLNGAYPNVNASDAKRTNIIEVYSVCKYILAMYATAEGAVQGIDPAKTQLVQPLVISRMSVQFFFPFHFVVLDNDRQMWVLEFGNYTNGDSFVWRNATEWGVVTNQPQYEEQIANLEEYIAANANVNETIAKVKAYEAEGTTNGSLPGILEPVPGSAVSKDRFVRLALFNRVGSWAPMPSRTASYMPPSTLPEQADNSELLTALQLINQVTVARGSAYSSAADSRSGLPGFDVTQVCTSSSISDSLSPESIL